MTYVTKPVILLKLIKLFCISYYFDNPNNGWHFR